uniref:Uncharacterized protein n=1 Tax=Solanum tuberosum TaxID=4113 RepID=M1ASE4_SOLTU
MKNRTKPKPKFEIQTFFTIRGKHSFLAISPKSERGKCESTVLTDFVVLEVLRVSIPRPQGRPCAATAAAATALFRGNVKETTKRSSVLRSSLLFREFTVYFDVYSTSFARCC